MGYTHYTRFKSVVTKDKLAKASADVEKAFELIKAECPDITIRNGVGKDEPIINERVICFNGDASKYEDYETFSVEVGDEGFNCCKTARMPYDVYVCVACLILKEHFGDELRLFSDGVGRIDEEKGIELELLLGENEYRMDEEWVKAIELYKKFKGIV